MGTSVEKRKNDYDHLNEKISDNFLEKKYFIKKK